MRSLPEIPGYLIKKEIGHGGMSRIFEAVDRIHDRKVALKIFVPSMANEKEAKARFFMEGEILSKLDHKSIVPVYDVGTYGDINYIAVEFLEGKSLKEWIHDPEGNRISVKEALIVLREISSALGYSHERGLIHRDIKPENILFRADGTPVLVDFGIARDFTSSRNFTMTGTSIGTPYYMSPEQIKGLPPDERNDIYSLGVVLFEMLTGDIPYKGTDIITVAIRHERDPIPALPGEISYLQDLINRMMAKKNADRPSNCKEVIRLIDGLGHSVVSDKKTVRKRSFLRRVRKVSLKILFFILLLLIPVMTGHFYKSGDDLKLVEEKKIRETVTEKISTDLQKETSEKKPPGIRLRSLNKIITGEDIKRSVIRFNFFDSEYNPDGNFINRYRTENLRQERVIIDGSTGLMWDHRGSFKSMSFSDAREWIRDLNKKGHAGYSDWRFPTVEEGASLLEKTKWYGDLHIFTVFSVVQKEIWTSDINADRNSNWIVSFKKGGIRTVSLFNRKSFVRPVRKHI